MKKAFERVEFSVIYLPAEDMITTSSDNNMVDDHDPIPLSF